MRRYETTYILRPNLGEEQFSEIIERTNKIIKGDGGAIINLERWGNKKLAFEIKKESFGQYVYFDYAAPGSTVHEMERIFRIDDRVLRFLTVKLADAIDEATIASETERAVATAAAKTAKAAEANRPDAENDVETDEEFTDVD
ncbi:MAG TPA: 30S ribosomal protein S6 [Desulfobulbaceae bacterium]|nr:30S ribosomal protein S6 [Desulfobulbaceae bacterium]